MNDVATKQLYRGVRCLSCRQPIPVPGILLRMELMRKDEPPGPMDETHTRVFSLRCRACEKEKLYRTSDIVEFEGEPRTRISRYHLIHANQRKAAAKSQAAGN